MTLALVDAHVHVWDRSRHAQSWIDPLAMAPIDRDFDLAALRADLGPTPLQGVVLVQSVPREAETLDLLATAQSDPLAAGVVGWVDLTDATVSDRLAGLRAAEGGHRLVGVRHLLQDELIRCGWTVRMFAVARRRWPTPGWRSTS